MSGMEMKTEVMRWARKREGYEKCIELCVEKAQPAERLFPLVVDM